MNFLKAAVLCFLLSALPARAVDDTVTIVDGISTNLGIFIPIGTNNLLIVTNGGWARSDSIFRDRTAWNNAAIIVGQGSFLTNGGMATFASQGSSNTLQFLNGGRTRGTQTVGGTNNLVVVENTSTTNGFTFNGRSNQFLVRNSTVIGALEIPTSFHFVEIDGSTLSGNLIMSDFTATNRIVLKNGGQHLANNWELFGVSNRYEMIGPNTFWRVIANALLRSSSASPAPRNGNVLEMSAGATGEVMGDLDIGTASPYNKFYASGTGTILRTTGLNLGAASGNSNLVSITDGAQVLSGRGTIGSGLLNIVQVSGAGSVWSNSTLIQINNTSNRIEVFDGGKIYAARLSSNGRGLVISNRAGGEIVISTNLDVSQQLLITGNGSVESGSVNLLGGNSNRFELSDGLRMKVLTNISAAVTSNLLVVATGSKLETPRVNLGLVNAGADTASNNLVRVTGAGSELNALALVSSSRWQRVTIDDGGLLQTENLQIKRGAFFLTVSNAASQWIHRGNVETSPMDSLFNNVATLDSFQALAGGSVTNFNTTIGRYPTNSSSLSSLGIQSMCSAVISGVGSKWNTASNVTVGFNANSNLLAVLDGGELTTSNLSVGVFDRPGQTTFGRIGSENWLRVEGPGSRVDASGNIVFGQRASNNRFTIANGAKVSGASFGGNSLPVGDTTNVFEIVGADSELSIGGHFGYSGGNATLLIDAGGQLRAQSARIAGYTTIRDTNSSVEITGLMEFFGKNLLVENSELTAGEMNLGWIFGPCNVKFTGPSTEVGAAQIHIKRIENQPQDAGITTVEILDSASVTSRWISIGRGATSGPPVVKVNGGFVYARGPDGTGILELENGTLEIQAGIVRADTLALTTTNTSIMASGNFDIANGAAGGNGDLRIGDTNAEAYLKGRITAATATLGNNAILKAVATDSALHALLTANSIAIDGTLTVLLAHDHKLRRGDSVTLFSALTITGAFDNVAFGERITTSDGAGSFLLTQENGKVTLAEFQSDIRLNFSFDAANTRLILSFPTVLNPQIQTSTNLFDWENVNVPIFEIVGDHSRWSPPIFTQEAQRFYRLAR